MPGWYSPDTQVGEEKRKSEKEKEREEAKEEAEEIYQQFKEGETLDIEDPMKLQKTGLL